MKDTPAAVIRLQKVSKTYRIGDSEVRAMQDISLEIQANEFVAIMGPSGSGKSTMLHILGLLDRPDQGAYYLEGRDVSKLGDDALASLRNRCAGFIFQQFHLLPRMSALQNVALPLIYSNQNHMLFKAEERIRSVGLEERKSHKPNELSGGQQQRVAIARSLVNDPLIIFADEPTGNLDSKSEEEIIGILRNLHRQGKTVVMVTHERDLAEMASRIICMRDGRIISDQAVKKTPRAKTEVPPAGSQDRSKAYAQKNKMFLTEMAENLRQGFQALLTNKMRSFLSMLGILIGVASVIAMLALGKGAEVSMQKSMSSLGTNLLSIRSGGFHRGGVAQEAGAVTRFTLQDAEALAKVPHIKRVSAGVSGRGQAVYGNKNWSTTIRGNGLDYAAMRAAVPVLGRYFNTAEMQRRARVAVLGQTLVDELFGGGNPVGRIIKINRIQFQVIGVLPKKGEGFGGNQDDTVVIPVTTAMYRMLGKKFVDAIDVEIDDLKFMEKAEEAIRSLLVKRHNVRPEDEEDAFSIRNMAEMQEALKSMTKTMTMLLGCIAAISLLVGGIGIMNIMLVSVTERTREIGLRKAIGARKKDIMLQFLIEAVVMTICGGVMGIATGVGIAVLITAFTGWVVSVSVSSVLVVTLFSIMVGLVFGLWPAQKAAELNPIEALRYE
ncbi:ABC transporter permease [candidate division FCPU426 bacterium]|nr:ABC transporter permease [candidate division FCPU426 bacterium]